MATIRNRVQLIGRVGKNPEILNLENGRKAAKFSLATNEYFTNSRGEKVENTSWHNIIFWNNRAEVVEKYVFKGKEIAVEGKLCNHAWEDKNGTKHYSTEVIGVEIELLGK